MNLHNLEGREQAGYTTWGCIWNQGQCFKHTSYELINSDETVIPMQSRITAWWPDGSVKWTAHTANAEMMSQTIHVRPLMGQDGEHNHSASFPQGNQAAKENNTWKLKNGVFSMEVPVCESEYLFQNVIIGDRTVLEAARAVLLLEEPCMIDDQPAVKRDTYVSVITAVELVEAGGLQMVVRYQGCHRNQGLEEKFPFTLYMKVSLETAKIDFIHTFFYDGEEERNYLKGLGIQLNVPMQGHLYNRHVKFQSDYGCFHETSAELLGGKGLPFSVYESQMSGKELQLTEENLKAADEMLEAIPIWSEFELTQDHVNHFSVRKKVGDDNCCYLNCLSGCRTDGGAALGSENGSLLLSIRDFWERFPSGYTFKNLEADMAEATIWLWSPKAEAMDFRHYANRGYDRYYYEGYSWMGATPYGISCTSEFSLGFMDTVIPSDQEVEAFSRQVKKPPQYVGEPQYYHDLKAFGRWSLIEGKNETERWLEQQLDLAVEFYKKEISHRNWYGMFDYGDFMHTYDPYRHQWRYDMGGFAWDNTELVPTMWLWLMFLRSGREDVFTMAEKLTRHTSEVDMYHLGEYKGLGSRHNVRHWGCPCKEVRISMAGHHRYYYYLTGDYRLGEIFEEIKDAEEALFEKDPLEAFYHGQEKPFPVYIRTGPDWSSLCGNWLTKWERFADDSYRDKIITGIEDIKKAPLALISGPDFGFDPQTAHLYYIGERATGGTHLQICMGAPQIWFELSELLGDTEWTKMLADYGRFYYLNKAEQLEQSSGIIGEKEFSLPYMAAAMAAFGAAYYGDRELACKTWKILISEIKKYQVGDGFLPLVHEQCGNQKELLEIPWISTNFTAQWCLNVIMALEFIRDDLPEVTMPIES